MHLGRLLPARFIQRDNRFVCTVEIDGKKEKALLRNTGRLTELLVPERRIYLREKNSGKYRFELLLVETENSLVCVNSHLPPLLLEEFLKREGYPWKAESIKKEVKVGSSRIDLLINGSVLVETKSVNLVKDYTALFPDAPTSRGRKHVRELMNLNHSLKPALVFVIQREDAAHFSPNCDTDPEFSLLVEEFAKRGFPVYAFRCRVEPERIYIEEEVPVKFREVKP